MTTDAHMERQPENTLPSVANRRQIRKNYNKKQEHLDSADLRQGGSGPESGLGLWIRMTFKI